MGIDDRQQARVAASLFAEKSSYTQEQDCMMCPPFLTPKFPVKCIFLCCSVSVHELL